MCFIIRLPPVDYLKKSGSASDMAMKATQPPMVSMMVFFTSWSPFCRLETQRLATLRW